LVIAKLLKAIFKNKKVFTNGKIFRGRVHVPDEAIGMSKYIDRHASLAWPENCSTRDRSAPQV